MCKRKFKEILYDNQWNAEYLFHLKETHGYDPQTFFMMLKETMRKEDKVV